jgi:hypothetical protein
MGVTKAPRPLRTALRDAPSHAPRETSAEIIVDHGDGEVGELDVLVAGVEPQRVERCLHGQSVPFREDAFRLLPPVDSAIRDAAALAYDGAPS